MSLESLIAKLDRLNRDIELASRGRPMTESVLDGNRSVIVEGAAPVREAAQEVSETVGTVVREGLFEPFRSVFR